jgi:hypothetical protein
VNIDAKGQLFRSRNESSCDTGLAFLLDLTPLSNRPSGFVTEVTPVDYHDKLEFDFVMLFLRQATFGSCWLDKTPAPEECHVNKNTTSDFGA